MCLLVIFRDTMVFSKYFPKRVTKFVTSGGTAALVEYATFSLLIFASLRLLLANTISFCVGLLVSYNLNRRWVFRSRGGHKKFGLYAAIAIFNLLVSNFIIFSVHAAGVSEFVAKIITMAIIAAYNYFLYRKFIFAD